MVVCKRVLYSGQVQGVGFRYTTRHVAQGFRITGHVRNLADGRVEVLAEGEAGDVDVFLKALEGQMAEYIEARSITDEPLQGYQGFVIRH
jgi:acylphosphatase